MEINKCTTRVGWIDFCKGIGIFLVVLGHILRDVIAVDYIYSFHMPLFFFLSGLVFNAGKYDWKTLLKSRFNSLLLPYVFFYLLTLVYYIIVESHFRPIETSTLQSIAGMFVAAQIDGLMEHNGILWFLPCLFTVELLCFAVSRINDIKKEILTVISLVAIGFLVRTPLPWCLNIAMVCLQFFFTGRIYKLLSNRIVTQLYGGGYKWIATFCLALLFSLVLNTFPNSVNIASCDYGNLFAFEVSAYLGIFFLVNLSECICAVGKIIIKPVEWLGRNTLVIFALHQPLVRIFRYLGDKIFTNFPVQTDLIVAVAVDLLILLCLVPVVYIFNWFRNRYLSRLYIR